MTSPSSTIRVETVYVTLDALMDTRLGTLRQIGKDVAERVLESGYHTRESDDFLGVDKDVFQTQYANRDAVTLSHSVVTKALPLLRDIVQKLTEQAITRPYHNGAKVVLNLFPYELSGEVKDEIRTCVTHWLNDLAPLELVFIPPKDLTPTHCKQNYSLMLVYEYEEWLNLHTPEFAHTRLPEVDLYAPALFCKIPTAEELEQITREAMHPFRATESLASPIIRLQLIDIQYFCVLQRQDITVTTTPAPAEQS